MKNQLKMAWRFHGDSILGTLVTEFGFGLVGVAVSLLVIFSEDAPTAWISGASAIALVGLAFVSAFSAITYQQEFIQALSMSRTRKEFMTNYALFTVIRVVLGYALVLVIYAVERSIYPQVFSLPEASEMTCFWVDWPFILVYIISAATLSMFVGALISRFGKKCTAVFYVVWVGLCINTSRIIEMVQAAQTGSGPLAWVLTIPAVAWISIGAAALIAMVYGIIHMGMKQMVK